LHELAYYGMRGWIGKTKEGAFRDLTAEYLKRVSR